MPNRVPMTLALPRFSPLAAPESNLKGLGLIHAFARHQKHAAGSVEVADSSTSCPHQSATTEVSGPNPVRTPRGCFCEFAGSTIDDWPFRRRRLHPWHRAKLQCAEFVFLSWTWNHLQKLSSHAPFTSFHKAITGRSQRIQQHEQHRNSLWPQQDGCKPMCLPYLDLLTSQKWLYHIVS